MKILFVCLGNICRSPMAEMIFKNLVRKKSLEKKFVISSAGISSEEEGNDIYPLAKQILKEKEIPIEKRCARKITQEDIQNFDYIVVMEEYQKKRILQDFSISKDKVCTLNEKDVSDPWYSGDFKTAYEEIYEGCKNLLDKIIKSYEL